MTSDHDNLIQFPYAKRSDPVHPTDLDHEELKQFAETIGHLARLGAIEPVNVQRAARVAKRIVQTTRLNRTLAVDGEVMEIGGELRPHPGIAMRDAAMIETQQLLNEMGLSPSER